MGPYIQEDRGDFVVTTSSPAQMLSYSLRAPEGARVVTESWTGQGYGPSAHRGLWRDGVNQLRQADNLMGTSGEVSCCHLESKFSFQSPSRYVVQGFQALEVLPREV